MLCGVQIRSRQRRASSNCRCHSAVPFVSSTIRHNEFIFRTAHQSALFANTVFYSNVSFFSKVQHESKNYEKCTGILNLRGMSASTHRAPGKCCGSAPWLTCLMTQQNSFFSGTLLFDFKDGCTSTAHWLQWFPSQLGTDTLGIGVCHLHEPKGVHGVLRRGECWNWSRHFSRAFGAPGALVPPRLELKTESHDQSLRHVSTIRYWDELLIIFCMFHAFSTMWSLHFKHLQHIQAPSVWLGEGSWGVYSGYQWRFHGATAHSAADSSGALTLCSSWFVWFVWSDWHWHLLLLKQVEGRQSIFKWEKMNISPA